MKSRKFINWLSFSISLVCIAYAPVALAMGTAFTYQGQLQKNNVPVTDTCNFEFKLFDALTEGNQVGSTLTKTGVAVANGLFTTTLDFGATAFPGAQRWMSVSAQCTGDTTFTLLSPRQELTPTPYSLNADKLDGYDAAAFWRTIGNAGTNPTTNFIGTTDNQALELRVNNARVMRLEPNVVCPNIVAGHSGNTVSSGASGATISGGGAGSLINRVTDSYGTVTGGSNNQAGNNAGTISDRPSATVSGGSGNTASGAWASIGGGYINMASGEDAVVSGGEQNVASGYNATVPGGGWNTAAGSHSFAAGRQAKANHHGAFVWGDNTAEDFASTTANEFAVRANGGLRVVVGTSALRIVPNATSPNFIGGLDGNSVTPGVVGATIAGGGDPGWIELQYYNHVTGDYGTVSGGRSNTAGYSATVSGGAGNTASGNAATVSGGAGNTANGEAATVSSGVDNTASGSYATVPGGTRNQAQGNYSFAAGYRAIAQQPGSFVWADSTNLNFDPWSYATPGGGPNSFNVRATGGVYFATSVEPTVAIPMTGVYISSGSGTWQMYSDRNAKANFAEVDARATLAAVAALPIQTWNYKTQDVSIRHIGPVAQDFAAAFQVGENDTTISSVDADGVALAAIQGLYQIVQERDATIATLQAEIATLKQQNAQVTAQQATIDLLLQRLVALEQAAQTPVAALQTGK